MSTNSQFAGKGDVFGALRLAEQLPRAVSVLKVYPAIVGKCVARKDQPAASTAVYQAMKQLKGADTEPPEPPTGIPASVIPGSTEVDQVLLGLSQLAKGIVTLNPTLALDVLDETVEAANRTKVDSGLGGTGFDVDVFRKLAPKDEQRVRLAAESLSDPLRQIVALASIYQWKGRELAEKEKTVAVKK